MIKSLLILLSAFPVFCSAQDSLLYGSMPFKNGKVVYEKVVTVDSIGKDQLYERARAWEQSYHFHIAGIRTDDREGGIIAYTGFFDQPFYSPVVIGSAKPVRWQYWATVKVLLKDGRAKIMISDIMVKRHGDPDFYIEDYPQMQDEVYKGMFKSFRSKDDAEAYKNFAKANERYMAIIAEVEGYLTGASRSEMDF